MKQGFRIPKRLNTALFQFEGDWDDAEVRVNLSIPFGLVLDMQALSDKADTGRLRELIKVFNKIALLEWNLEEDDGTPIPTQPDGLERVPMEFARAIMTQTMQALGQVPDPLAKSSSNGRILIPESETPPGSLPGLS